MGAGTQGCGGPLGCPPALSHPPQLTCRCLHKLQRLQKSAKPPDSPDSRAVVQTLQMLSRNFIFCSSPCGIYATNPQRSGGAPRAGSTPPHPTHSPPAPSFYLHPGLDKLVDGVHGLLLQHVHLQVVEGCGQRARGAIRGGAGDPPGGWGGAGCLCEREGVLHSRPRGTATSSSSSSSGVM